MRLYATKIRWFRTYIFPYLQIQRANLARNKAQIPRVLSTQILFNVKDQIQLLALLDPHIHQNLGLFILPHTTKQLAEDFSPRHDSMVRSLARLE
jgi:hypothetical protein